MQNRLKWNTLNVHLNQQAVKLSFSTQPNEVYAQYNKSTRTLHLEAHSPRKESIRKKWWVIDQIMLDAHKRKEIFVMRFEVVIRCKVACTRRPTRNVDDLGSVFVDPTCSQTFQVEPSKKKDLIFFTELIITNYWFDMKWYIFVQS